MSELEQAFDEMHDTAAHVDGATARYFKDPREVPERWKLWANIWLDGYDNGKHVLWASRPAASAPESQ